MPLVLYFDLTGEAVFVRALPNSLIFFFKYASVRYTEFWIDDAKVRFTT